MQVSSEKKKTGKAAYDGERESLETSHHTWALFFRHKEATEGSESLLTDILASCPRTAASCSFKYSFLLLHFSLPSLIPTGSVFKRLDSCLHLLLNGGIVVLPSL